MGSLLALLLRTSLRRSISMALSSSRPTDRQPAGEQPISAVSLGRYRRQTRSPMEKGSPTRPVQVTDSLNPGICLAADFNTRWSSVSHGTDAVGSNDGRNCESGRIPTRSVQLRLVRAREFRVCLRGRLEHSLSPSLEHRRVILLEIIASNRHRSRSMNRITFIELIARAIDTDDIRCVITLNARTQRRRWG